MYEELKKLAENATPGPWKSTVDGVMPVGEAFGIFGNFGANNGEANREFIAAANPSAVLALIAENERLECMLENYNIDAKVYKDSADQLKAENDALRAMGRQMVKGIDDWNESMEKIMGKQVGYHWAALEEMRALSKDADQ